MSDSFVHIPAHVLPKSDEKVFLAISGGLDSVVLFHLLQTAKINIHLLHVNYNLRGEDSSADEKFVRELAKENAVPLSVLNYDTKAHLAEKGGNLQNEARKIRYSFFQTYLKKEPDSILMTAHHFDDQMETFFMHLTRKSGLVGLSCMLEKNGHHWRPLLTFSKQQLLEYAKEKQLKWREDVSNFENKYVRNLWRNEWLPKLKTEVPSLSESVRILIQTFQEERKLLEIIYLPKANEIAKHNLWYFKDFDASSDEGKYLVCKELGLRFSEKKRLDALRNLGKAKYFEVDRMKLTIWNEGDSFSFQKNDRISLPTLKIEPITSLPKTFDKMIYFADKTKIVGELKLRFWREGDRIASLGMKGTQLVSDIMKDAKIPVSEKRSALILEDDRNILWCVGLKISRLAVADSTCKSIVRVSIWA